MVERVRNDGVLLGEEGFEQTAVGIEAGGIENSVFGVEVFADGAFEFFMKILGAADESY